jgi:predicted transposase/invertase (TIGR01784 family)
MLKYLRSGFCRITISPWKVPKQSRLLSTSNTEATRRQLFGKPTFDALFKYVVEKPSIQPSLFHALAGLNITSATRIDDHMNPLQELENLRQLINDKKTVDAAKSVKKEDEITVVCEEKGWQPVFHTPLTKFVKNLLPYFDDLRRACPKQRYDGTMDFVCELSSGEYAMVEMRVIPHNHWDRRALAYVAAFYAQQMKRGSKWTDIKRVIGINILGGGKDKVEHWKDAPTEHTRHYKLQEQLNTPSRYIDGIEIIQYSMMHVSDNKEKLDWFTFFKKAQNMTEEDVQEKISTPAVLEAFEMARLDSLPEAVREMYSSEESEYDRYSIHTQELVEKGRAEGRAKTFRMMKIERIPDEKIKKILNLSDEEFEEYSHVASV